MTPRPTSGAEPTPVRVVLISLDAHIAGAVDRARKALEAEIPGLELRFHAATGFSEPKAAEAARADIAEGHIIFANMLFIEEHIQAVLPALQARREHCDAMVCAMSAAEVTKLTRMGKFDMSAPASGFVSLLKRLRGKAKETADAKVDSGQKTTAGAQQMKMLRRVPQILRFIPGPAQDVRAYFLTLQYWLGGSEENMANMVRYLVDRYADGPRRHLRGTLKAAPPGNYPEVGVYHPRLKGRIAEKVEAVSLVDLCEELSAA